MAEALQAVIDFFFSEVNMNCVNACHDLRNPNSGKVMQKCGMVYEGTWRAGGINNQGVCDEVWYSILKKEYEEKRQPGGIWDKLYEKASAVCPILTEILRLCWIMSERKLLRLEN